MSVRQCETSVHESSTVSHPAFVDKAADGQTTSD